MKFSLRICNIFEETSSPSPSVFFLCFFALFVEEGLLVSPCCSLELCIQLDILFPFFPCFSLLFYSQLFVKASLGNPFVILHFFFFGLLLFTTSCAILWTSIHSSTGTLCTSSNPLNLFIISLYNHQSVQSLSPVWLFATPWTAVCQASLSTTNSQSLLKHMSIKLVMPSNHLIFCRTLLLLPSIFPRIRVFSKKSVLHIRWPKHWSFSFSISPFSDFL